MCPHPNQRPPKRRMMSDFEVHIPDESSMHDFLVAFPGPEDSEFFVSVVCYDVICVSLQKSETHYQVR